MKAVLRQKNENLAGGGLAHGGAVRSAASKKAFLYHLLPDTNYCYANDVSIRCASLGAAAGVQTLAMWPRPSWESWPSSALAASPHICSAT